MSRDQQSISVSARLYRRLMDEARARDCAIAALVEAAVAPVLGTTPPPVRAFSSRCK